jgi:hypothetical protein
MPSVRAFTHRQLVAEIAGGRVTHSRISQVLAQKRRRF